MADEVCVVSGYWAVNVELLFGYMQQWELGGYKFICQM